MTDFEQYKEHIVETQYSGNIILTSQRKEKALKNP